MKVEDIRLIVHFIRIVEMFANVMLSIMLMPSMPSMKPTNLHGLSHCIFHSLRSFLLLREV
jgi:Na+/glutamate symporter